MNKTIWAIVVLALVVAGFLFYRNQETPSQTQEEQISETEEAREEEEAQEPQPVTEADLPEASEIKDSPFSETALLTAVDGSDSEGMAYKLLADRYFIHYVEASMPEPAEGSVYEGWLVQPEPLKFFSTGVMEQNAEGMWTLEFVSDESEYPTYTQVIITEETKVDAQPEKHILQGSF